MKQTLLLRYLLPLTLAFLSVKAAAQTSHLQWANGANGTSFGHRSQAFDLCIDEQGNTYTVGKYQGTVTFSPTISKIVPFSSGTSLFIQKTDVNGTVVWVKNLDPTTTGGQVVGNTIEYMDGVLYVGGYFAGQTQMGNSTSNGDIFVISIDTTEAMTLPSNTYIGATPFGTDKGEALDLKVKGSSVYVTGYFSGVVDFDGAGAQTAVTPMQKDIFFLRLDIFNLLYEDGATWGSSADDQGTCIAVAPNGDVLIGGSFQGQINFGQGVAIPKGTQDGFALMRINGGTVVGSAVFSSNTPNNSYTEITTIYQDASGIYLGGNYQKGSTTQGTCTFHVFNAGVLSPASVGAIGTSTASWFAGFVTKVDGFENISTVQWARITQPNTDESKVKSIDRSPQNGHIYVTGYCQGTVSFPNGYSLTPTGYRDAFIWNIDGNAPYDTKSVQALYGVNGSASSEGTKILVDPQGIIRLSGFFNRQVDFDPSPTTAYTLDAGNGYAQTFAAALFPQHPDLPGLLAIRNSILDATGTPVLSNAALGSERWDENNQDLETWKGVRLNINGRVDSIDLNNLKTNLQATVPFASNTLRRLPDGIFANHIFEELIYLTLNDCNYNAAPTTFWFDTVAQGYNNTTLTRIYLNNNLLGADGATNADLMGLLPYVAAGFDNLDILHVKKAIASNGIGIDTIFYDAPIPSNRKFKAVEIQLDENNLTGLIPPPADVLKPGVLTLDLYKNKLSGADPNWQGSVFHFNNFNIDDNLFLDAADVRLLLYNLPNLWNFQAANVMAPSGNREINLGGTTPTPSVSTLKFLYMPYNGFYTPTGSCVNIHNLATTGGAPLDIDLSYNAFNSVCVDDNISYEIFALNLSHNQLEGEIPPAIFLNMDDLQYLHLHHNQFSGTFPSPNPATYYPLGALQELFLDNNNLEGAIPMDWLFKAAITASPLRNVNLSENNFDTVYATVGFMPTFNSLENFNVQNNRLDFFDLYNIAMSVDMQYNGFSNYYYPQANNTLGAFAYTPQQPLGIGGVRQRQPLDTIVINEQIDVDPNGVTEYIWARQDTIATASTDQFVGYAQLGAGATVVSNLELGNPFNAASGAQSTSSVPFLTGLGNFPVTNHTHTIDNEGALVINDAVASIYGSYNSTDISYYYTKVYNTRFPDLELSSQPKRVIVDYCRDTSGQVILCQQAFVQFNGNFSALKSGQTLTEEEKMALRKDIGVRVIKSCPCGDLEMWEISDTTYRNFLQSNGKGTRNAATATSGKPGLLSANANYEMNDTTGTFMPTASGTVAGNTGNPAAVRVAIIDSGVDYDHPLLQNHILAPVPASGTGCDLTDFGYNFLDTTAYPYDDLGHGTHVAGVLAGVASSTLTMRSPLDITNLNNQISLMPFRYTDAAGRGTLFDATCAMYMAIENGAKVINASWGYWGDECPGLQDAIRYAETQNAIVVCAAGNDGDPIPNQNGRVHWPSAYSGSDVMVNGATYDFELPNIVSVAALSANDQDVLAHYSNYSNALVHLATDGFVNTTTVDTLVSDGINQMKDDEGTSFAAPKVARAIALLWSIHPTADFCAVKEALRQGVEGLPTGDSTKLIWGGRMNFNLSAQILQDSANFAACSMITSAKPIKQTAAKETTLAIYPNPFGGNIHLQWIDANDAVPYEIRVYGIEGKLHYQHTSFHAMETIATHDWQAGFYILQVKRGDKTYTEKLVKYE